eukprot:s359_g5.t1
MNTDGTITAFCNEPQQYDFANPVHLHDQKCHVVAADSYSVTVRPTQAMSDLPESCTLTQDRIRADPNQILDMLTNYWTPFWNSTQDRPTAKVEFEHFLRALPQNLPGPALDLEDDKLWATAVKTLKVPSARGDSWSVVAILSLAYAWSLQLRRGAPNAFVSAYADNWS